MEKNQYARELIGTVLYPGQGQRLYSLNLANLTHNGKEKMNE